MPSSKKQLVANGWNTDETLDPKPVLGADRSPAKQDEIESWSQKKRQKIGIPPRRSAEPDLPRSDGLGPCRSDASME